MLREISNVLQEWVPIQKSQECTKYIHKAAFMARRDVAAVAALQALDLRPAVACRGKDLLTILWLNVG